jgi:hypothetical protein
MNSLLGFACMILGIIQLMVSDRWLDDRRRIIWVIRQTTRWKQMVRDMDFAVELYELEHAR